MGEWYYIGHYGQLGPLTVEQMDELIQGGVISKDTFVWRSGMTDWVSAVSTPELSKSFATVVLDTPPPPPSPSSRSTTIAPPATSSSYLSPGPTHYPSFSPIKSDRSRTAAGILQILVPGVGRMYSGYVAIGVLQLVLSPCVVGWVWSVIDGIIILSGGVKMDGYGRQMGD